LSSDFGAESSIVEYITSQTENGVTRVTAQTVAAGVGQKPIIDIGFPSTIDAVGRV
jgi:hypothetical protein